MDYEGSQEEMYGGNIDEMFAEVVSGVESSEGGSGSAVVVATVP